MADTKAEEARMFTQLYSKLAEVMATSGPNAVLGQNFLALCSPGIPIPESKGFPEILDKVPEQSWVYTVTGDSVARVYDEILEGREYPPLKLSKEQKEELQEAEEQVAKDYNAYIEYASKYRAVLVEFENARVEAANQGTDVPTTLVESLNQARGEWSALGHKGRYEKAQGTVTYLSQLGPAHWWEVLANEYANAKGSSSVPPSGIYPSFGWVTGDEGWQTFKFNAKDIENQDTSSVVAAEGSAGFDGLFSLGGTYEHKDQEWTSDSSSIEISFEMKRALISRPWMDAGVFSAHSWRFSSAHKNTIISTGGAPPSPETKPRMPLLPTGILVSRNLKVSGRFSTSDKEFIKKHIEGGGSVGWGPFSISAHYNQENTEEMAKGTVDETGFEAPFPQVIGFLCDMLPLCPSPDPTLPWPS